MHEAELSLPSEKQDDYACWLGVKELSPIRPFQFVTSTARQRAEAFLRTIGKRREDAGSSGGKDRDSVPPDPAARRKA
jgi:hypothetical protein